MVALYEQLQSWQDDQQKRLLSTNIQLDCGKYCCIALTNPTEVVITDRWGTEYAVVKRGMLAVNQGGT